MCRGAGGTTIFILIFLHLAPGRWQAADPSPSRGFSSSRNSGALWKEPLQGWDLSWRGWNEPSKTKKKPKKSRSRGKFELGLVLSLAWKILQDPHPAATRELPGSMAFSISSLVFHSQLPALELPSHGLFPNKPLRALRWIYPSWFPHPTGYGVGVRDYCLFLSLSQKAAASPRKIHLLVPRCAELFHFI